ncbi:MAG: glycosyltransferase family 4 protein [Desulfobacterales bacterium]
MKRPLKVVQLTEDLGIGGQEKVIAILAEGIDRRKYDPEVWCLARGGPLAEALGRSGIRVRVLGLDNYHDPSQVLRLSRRLRRAGADIVHAHGSFAGTFGRLACLFAGRRHVLVHVHTTEPHLTRRHLGVQRMLAPFTRAVVCVSHAVRRFVTGPLGIPAGKCRVVYNGVPEATSGASGIPERAGPAEGSLAVALGHLVENKGHRVLIEAFRRVTERRTDLRLWIVGDGPLRADLERQAQGLRFPDRIRFTGRLADVHPVLARADMVIQPSLYREALSLALIEAAQHGLPAVASRLGGIPEVIAHGRTGLLVPPGDPEALAAAILQLAADPGLRSRLGRAARAEYEQRFRAERMIAEIEAVYAAF